MISFLQGLKFGFLLQAGSIGPICLFLFQLAAVLPLYTVIKGVFGVVLADSIYISCAIIGIAPLVKKIKKSENLFKKISGIFLCCLGLFFISFAFNSLNTLSLTQWVSQNIFLGLLTMTLLNPVSIIVFTGILTTEIIDKNLSKKSLFLFAFGIICAGFLFLSGVSILGKCISSFLPNIIIKGLNIAVGTLLCYWGISHLISSNNGIKK